MEQSPSDRARTEGDKGELKKQLEAILPLQGQQERDVFSTKEGTVVTISKVEGAIMPTGWKIDVELAERASPLIQSESFSVNPDGIILSAGHKNRHGGSQSWGNTTGTPPIQETGKLLKYLER